MVEFDELYARHLCRHSQLGINVVHLAALFAVWYAAYTLLAWATGVEWVLVIPALVYLLAIAPSAPIRVFLATTVFMALIVASAWLLPMPWWACLLVIPIAYKVQSWSHKFYTV